MNKQKESIISAGIDIGTSTTKLIISRLSMINVAGIAHVPRIEIVDKEVLYKSPVYRTPLRDQMAIDMAAVESMIHTQYDNANISADQIETGAVIITGEAATKTNASEIVHHLSKEAGEFLVATAGPDLEGIIAAKGSGVYAASKDNALVRANVDIGGGTANIAVYQNQKLLGTCTLHVGGRLIEFESGKIQTISPPIQRLIEQEHIPLEVGHAHTDVNVARVIELLIDTLYRALTNTLDSRDSCLILGKKPDWTVPIDVVTFSGGISECMYQHEGVQGTASYEDIGVQLAKKIQESVIYQDFMIEEPAETVRATVLGAGMQTTEISGATIQIDASKLPLKNIPIMKHDFNQQLQAGLEALPQTIQQARTLYDATNEGSNFALSLSSIPFIGFTEVQALATTIKRLMDERTNPHLPIILVVETDVAKVLGQTLIAMGTEQAVICIDQIKVETGDYIDIGKALQSNVVPVIVKTLTFHSIAQ